MDKVKCIHCRKLVSKEHIAVLIDGTRPLCQWCDDFLQIQVVYNLNGANKGEDDDSYVPK